MVRSNCSSVSPGKPTIMSVLIETPGMVSRMRPTKSRYSVAGIGPAHPRSSTSSSPAWTGRFMCSQTLGRSATAL